MDAPLQDPCTPIYFEVESIFTSPHKASQPSHTRRTTEGTLSRRLKMVQAVRVAALSRLCVSGVNHALQNKTLRYPRVKMRRSGNHAQPHFTRTNTRPRPTNETTSQPHVLSRAHLQDIPQSCSSYVPNCAKCRLARSRAPGAVPERSPASHRPPVSWAMPDNRWLGGGGK